MTHTDAEEAEGGKTEFKANTLMVENFVYIDEILHKEMKVKCANRRWFPKPAVKEVSEVPIQSCFDWVANGGDKGERDDKRLLLML